jgi:hypothetical protein
MDIAQVSLKSLYDPKRTDSIVLSKINRYLHSIFIEKYICVSNCTREAAIMRMRVPTKKFKIISNAFDFNFFDYQKRNIRVKDPSNSLLILC